MIDALIAGRLCGAPQAKTAKTGKPFATAKMRATTGDGEAVFVNAIAFDDHACAALLALGDGDAVSLAGALTPRAWVDRAGHPKPALDMVVHAVLTPYHVTRKRRAMERPGASSHPTEHAANPLNDDPLDF